jgi:hypothetical protein
VIFHSDFTQNQGIIAEKIFKITGVKYMGLGDRLNKMAGKTRFVVSRLFVHLVGEEVTPLLGVLNRAAIESLDAEGDLDVLGEQLVNVCEGLLQYDTYWRSGFNEGDVFWDEGEAGDYFNKLFTDSDERYDSSLNPNYLPEDELLSLPLTGNLVVMLVIAFEGEDPNIETDLASIKAIKQGLKSIINLHHNGQLRGISIQFSPAEFGDELTDEQVLLNFSELVPL